DVREDPIRIAQRHCQPVHRRIDGRPCWRREGPVERDLVLVRLWVEGERARFRASVNGKGDTVLVPLASPPMRIDTMFWLSTSVPDPGAAALQNAGDGS